MVNFEKLIVIDCLHLIHNVVDCESIEFKAIKYISLQLMFILVFLMFDIGSFGPDKEEVPFPSNHCIFDQILFSSL